MLSKSMNHAVRQSIVYTFVISQPFAFYANAYPALKSEQLLKTENLQYGCHGEAVRDLQHNLNKLSYFNNEIDGHYGLLTEYALKTFQSHHNLTITGQANTKTLSTVINKEKEHYQAQL